MREGVKEGIGMIDRLRLGVLVVGLLLSVADPAAAQQEGGGDYLPISFGIVGGYGITLYSGEVDLGSRPELGGGTCGILDDGGGSGVVAGAFLEYRLSPRVRVGLRGLLEDNSGVMTLDLPLVRHRLPSSAVVDVASQYRLDLDASIQTVELYGSYTPFTFPLMFVVGPKIGIPSSPTFTFAEEIEANESITFENGTTRQQYAAGAFDGSILYGLHVGAEYRLPMGSSFELQPAIALYTYLNGLVAGADGPVISGVRPSIGLHYRLGRPAPEPPVLLAQEPVPPPAPPTPPGPVAAPVELQMVAVALAPDGTESDRVGVSVEVRSQIREIPLLPYVFFDAASADLPERYRQGSLPGADRSGVEVYRHLLDILGERMSRSDGEVVLVGTIDGSAAEQRVEGLARKRAASVGAYLSERWGIDPERVDYRERGLPENRANPELPGASAENRRVEILTDAAFLAPWRLVDSVRLLEATPLQFRPRQTSGEPVGNWRLDLQVDGRSLRNVVGSSRLPNRVDVEPTPEEITTMLSGDRLSWRLTGRNGEGMADTLDGSLPIVVRRSGEERPMLDGGNRSDGNRWLSTPILFGYNSAEITAEAREILEAFRRRIPSGAILRITGYADDLGGSDYNRLLSRRRAEAVAALFPEADTTIIAAGEVPQQKGDPTPEARYYARTVRIELGE